MTKIVQPRSVDPANIRAAGSPGNSTFLRGDGAWSECVKWWADDVASLPTDTDLTYTAGKRGTVAAGDYVRTRAEGFGYKIADSGATDHHLTTAGGVKLYVAKGGTMFGAAFGMDASKSSTENTSILDTILSYADDGAPIVLPAGAEIDWSNLTTALTGTRNTIFAADGSVIIGDVAICPATEKAGHAVFVNRHKAGQTTRVYAQPPEPTLGHTEVSSGVVTSFTAFFDAYDAQGAQADTDPNWTGPHYRDGGISCYVDTTPPAGDALVPEYSPAGIVVHNAKVGGNWWPFRPASAISISEKPHVTIFQIPTTVANAGPTFAGGGVYPTDRWRPGKTYSAGDIVHEYGRVYEVTVGGVSGQTPPLHDGVGGALADAWDASILTTVGTLSGGFYVGSDGGGQVQYALLEQLYPATLDVVTLIGPALVENPAIGLGDGCQIATATYLLDSNKLVAARRNTDGSGTTNDAGLHGDLNGAMRFGYSATAGLLARHNDTTNLHFDGVSASYDEIVKPDGDTTVDVSGVNVVKFNDSSAVNFTGFTNAKQGQVIYMLFNNSNTTIVHNASSLQIPGGANITPDSNDGYIAIMRSATVAQILN